MEMTLQKRKLALCVLGISWITTFAVLSTRAKAEGQDARSQLIVELREKEIKHELNGGSEIIVTPDPNSKEPLVRYATKLQQLYGAELIFSSTISGRASATAGWIPGDKPKMRIPMRMPMTVPGVDVDVTDSPLLRVADLTTFVHEESHIRHFDTSLGFIAPDSPLLMSYSDFSASAQNEFYPSFSVDEISSYIMEVLWTYSEGAKGLTDKELELPRLSGISQVAGLTERFCRAIKKAKTFNPSIQLIQGDKLFLASSDPFSDPNFKETDPALLLSLSQGRSRPSQLFASLRMDDEQLTIPLSISAEDIERFSKKLENAKKMKGYPVASADDFSLKLVEAVQRRKISRKMSHKFL